MSLRFDGVSAAYAANGRVGRRVLDAVSLELRPGQVVGVVGPNGAGKSTLLRLASGRLAPLSGAVTLGGRSVQEYGRFELARSLAVVAQTPAVPAGFRVRDVVAMGRAPHLGLFGAPGAADKAAIDAALATTGTLAFQQRRVETLSGGELQRVVFARALAQQPRYLLLDEPTNHLDLRYQIELLTYARRQAAEGVAVMLILHDLNLAARSCDSLVVLQGGHKVAEGAPALVLTADLIADVYGARVRLLDDDGVPVVVPDLGSFG